MSEPGSKVKNMAEFAFIEDRDFILDLEGVGMIERSRDFIESFNYRALKSFIKEGRLYRIKAEKQE